MLTIDVNNEEHDLKYREVLYFLFCDFGRDMNLGLEENNYFLFSDNRYAGKLKEILPLVEVWALRKYMMFIRFNFNKQNSVDTLDISWEDLTQDEIEKVLLNMYPKKCPDATSFIMAK